MFENINGSKSSILKIIRDLDKKDEKKKQFRPMKFGHGSNDSAFSLLIYGWHGNVDDTTLDTHSLLNTVHFLKRVEKTWHGLPSCTYLSHQNWQKKKKQTES